MADPIGNTSHCFRLQTPLGKQVSRIPLREELVLKFHPLYLQKTESCLEVIRTLGLEQEVVDKCEKWLQTDPLEVCRLFTFDYLPPTFFTTINHSDCWMNNIMFKYNDQNQVEDLKFVSKSLS